MREFRYDVYIKKTNIPRLKHDLGKISNIRTEVDDPQDPDKVVVSLNAEVDGVRKRRSIEQAIKKHEGKIVGEMIQFQDISRKTELWDFFDKNAAGLFIAWIAAFGTGAVSAFTSDFTKAISPLFPWHWILLLTVLIAIGNVYTTQKA